MEDKKNEEKEFDPTMSEEFYKNLEQAFQPEDEDLEKWEPEVEEDSAWIDIEEGLPKEEPVSGEPSGDGEAVSEVWTGDGELASDVRPEDGEAVSEVWTGDGELASDMPSEDRETASESWTGDGKDASFAASEEEMSATREEGSSDPEEELPTLDLSGALFEIAPTDDAFQEKEPADDVLLGINAALAEQMEQEFGKDLYKEKKESSIKRFFQSIPRWTKILVSVLLVLLLACFLLFGTSAGRGLLSRIAVEILFSRTNPVPSITPPPEGELTPLPSLDPEDPEITPDPNATPVPTPVIPSGEMVEDSTVINVLLIGVENMTKDTYGRSDAMILASIDKDGGPLKLVSFMRDIYVQIPTTGKNRKLNAAYASGGADLLVQTIEYNFKVKIDSYVIIQFEAFEDMIDQLGGLEISLTAEESAYLNRTNYISNRDERNTRPGTQLMSGSQVLGFCRIRMVTAANGASMDFGRTYRQRYVLQKLFEKYKEKNLAELLSVMNTCFNYVSTPASLKPVAAECLQAVIEKKMFTLETMQYPVSKHYEGTTVTGVGDVIIAMPDNVDLLRDFLYREE